MDEDSTFDYLYQNRNDPEIGQKINVRLVTLRRETVVSCAMCFAQSTSILRWILERCGRKHAHSLRNLLEDFHGLNLRPSQLDANDIIGDAYEYMIAMFASDAGKKGGNSSRPARYRS